MHIYTHVFKHNMCTLGEENFTIAIYGNVTQDGKNTLNGFIPPFKGLFLCRCFHKEGREVSLTKTQQLACCLSSCI